MSSTPGSSVTAWSRVPLGVLIGRVADGYIAVPLERWIVGHPFPDHPHDTAARNSAACRKEA
jgi:hypothetical protein